MAHYRDYNRDDRYHRRQKKKSGAKEGTYVTKDGVTGMYISAWNYSRRRGLLVCKAFENSKSKKYESERGNTFISMMFECFYKDNGNKVLEVALYNTRTGKVFLEKLGMVISTKAPNGGYFGQIKSK